jgi:uncharacterized protein (TIGR03086 family)
MTLTRDPLDLLARALDQTGALIAGVRPDQATLPTPCRAWDVRALVNHVVYDVQHFTALTRGQAWTEHDADLIDGDWLAAYRAAAAGLLAVWREPGALERPVRSPAGEQPATWRLGQQITDLAVHGWDIARATGQSTDLDPELGRLALEWARQNLQPQFRGPEGSGRAFGPEVRVPDDAPLYDRLAGFFGRDPR